MDEIMIDTYPEYTAEAVMKDGWIVYNNGTFREMIAWAEDMLKEDGICGIYIKKGTAE